MQSAIHAIRTTLRQIDPSGDPLLGGSAGYHLRVAHEQLDLAVFVDQVTRARSATAADRPTEAVRLLRAALNLWRGPALADASGAFVEVSRAFLADQHLAAIEDLYQAYLNLGANDVVLAAAAPLVADA